MSDENKVENNNNKSTTSSQSFSNVDFITKIIDFLTGSTSEDRIRKRKLKEIARHLTQLKYKFYNPKKDLILPGFGNYFYEIFRICQNFSKFFDVKNHSNTIKIILFDSLLTEKQKSLKEKLEKEYIEDLIRNSNDLHKAIEEIKSILNSFVKSFDSEIVKIINTTYNQIVDLSNIINFDWYSLLHKMDSNITETNFNYKPNFEPLEGKYVLEDLISINDNIFTLNLNSDWKYVYNYVSMVYEDKTLVDLLKKLISLLKVIKKDDYLTKIIQLISKDPFFSPKDFHSKAKIVQDYISGFQIEIQKIVQETIKLHNKEKLNKLLVEIFKTTIIIRLKNYTQKLDEALKSKGIQNTFKYIEPMNYLKAFLLDIGKGDIKARIDQLIIKGTWDTNIHSSEYSSLLEKFNILSDKVIDFDNKCGEDEVYGKELKRLMLAVKHDSKAKMLLVKLIEKIDSNASQILIEGINILNLAANLIKALIEDFSLKNPKMIINFHKIKWDFPNSNIKADLLDIYKKILNMNVLLKNYIKTEESEKEKK
ncbi:MAG TPA: hypothetical protein PLE45_07965 [Spirochaetota bacterium]|nr:hypothetical protein [Spirochaetota bacterium]HOL57098.1 hypothetical protein [Spirochaetota bacterium]HPP04670.1 hypothetical protein [Spirochaetota bacterium]